MKYRITAALAATFVSGSLFAATATPRIVGGDDADTDWLSLVALIDVPAKQEAASAWATYPVFQAQYCGGTLLSQDWVLTAAHCVQFNGVNTNAADIELLIGSQTLDVATNSPLLHSAASVIVHPGYNQLTNANDIALIQLDEPVTIGSNVQPGVLATPGTDEKTEELSNYNDILSALGWGVVTYDDPERQQPVYSLDLQEVALDYVPNAFCQNSYNLNGNSESILDSMLCANEPSPDGNPDGDPFGEDSCQGDSGGPLFVTNTALNDSPQVGVTSFGYACGDADLPGVYTRVSEYLDWIEQQTSIADLALRNLAIAENPDSFQGFQTIDFQIPVENAGNKGATNFALTIEHPKAFSLSSSEAGLSCAASSNGLTECNYDGTAILGGSTKSLAFTATDANSQSGATVQIQATVELDRSRDYHRLNNTGTITLQLGQPELTITAEPVCLSSRNNAVEMRFEASVANLDDAIDSVGTRVTGSLPEALTLVNKNLSSCTEDNGDYLCQLGLLEANSEKALTVAIQAAAETMAMVTIAVENDNGTQVGSSLETTVALDFSREDLEACPSVTPPSTLAPRSSGGGGGSLPLGLLSLLMMFGLYRRKA
ncbi:serine protease [Alcanivorax sp.]|jgi:secreted trypsin-like serine protease|uniref:serine protease n=1 Tax=Alcanivorax sp. TaxID=1872427 RepID=UPI00261744AF|nr:serine protease [Alcanivorax sp.]